MNLEKDKFISTIKYKLTRGERLNEAEISSVVSALIKEKGYTQKPYFEIVYHDKFDRKERSIMQPEPPLGSRDVIKKKIRIFNRCTK